MVLVPLDFSVLSDAALQRASQFARQFGSKLVLVHAVEPIIQPVEYAIVPAEMEEINQRQVSSCQTRLERFQQRLKEEGIDCKVVVKLGRPWHVITETAKRLRCDLIVIPTHGRSGLKHLLMGSTAERVVQHAPCSVLIVR
jgi:nucleotide-binding universal stress UspA family protein